MNRACQEFRGRLAQALDASAQRVFAPELEWHTHVLTCAECRALLESEQALEHVLASLPQPTLPPHLVRRVLERLAQQRVDAALDRTLDLALRDPADAGRAAPGQLASELLARLGPARAQAERERRLERALDTLLASAPQPQVPPGLSARVLKRLAAARRDTVTPVKTSLNTQRKTPVMTPTPAPRALRAVGPARADAAKLARDSQPTARSWAWLAAAGVALFAGAAAWFLSRQGAGEARRDDYAIELQPAPQVRREELAPQSLPAQPEGSTSLQVAQSASDLAPDGASDAASGAATGAVSDRATSELEPELELLAQLELLESWELLTDEALELELLGVDENTLLSLQSLEFESAASELDDTPAPSAPSSGADNVPKNG